jgi:hypothetical protein
MKARMQVATVLAGIILGLQQEAAHDQLDSRCF